MVLTGLYSPQAGSLAAAAALAPVLTGPLAGVLGDVAARRRVLYSASAAGPTLWVGLAVAAAAGGLVMLRVEE